MPAQFQISPRLQALIASWPSRVTSDVPELQMFQDVNYPTPRRDTANKSISIYFSKSDGTYDQIFVADSALGNEMQVSDL